MEDRHLAPLGGLLHRRLGGLRLFILLLIFIRFCRPGLRYRPPFRSHGVCRHGSFPTGGCGEAGIGQGPVWAQFYPAPGAEIRFHRELLPAIVTELGNFRSLFVDRRFTDFFMDHRPPWRFGGFSRFGFHNRAPDNMFGYIPFYRTGMRLCQRFHGTFHGNLHGRLDFGFFHRRHMITGCRQYLAFRLGDNRGLLFYRFHNLPDLGTPGRGGRLRFVCCFRFRCLGK